MTVNAVVRARIDNKTKDEAALVLAAIGITISDAFRMLLTRVANEKALPFEPLRPNTETIAAIKAARNGDLVTVGSDLVTSSSVDNLLKDLNADNLSANN